jgi:hypothetical protein
LLVYTIGNLAMKFVSVDNNVQPGTTGMAGQINGTANFNQVSFSNNADYGANLTVHNAMTLTKVKASGNLGPAGFFGVNPTGGDVTVSNSQFDSNGALGLYASTPGSIVYKGVSASNNSTYGAYAIGTSLTSSVTVSGKSASSRANFNGNTNGYGVYVTSQGAATVKNVNASFNTIGVYAAQLGAGNLASLSNITVTSNKAMGAILGSNSDGVVSNMKAIQNGMVTDSSGLYLQTSNRPVTVSKSTFMSNGKEGIHADLGTGTLTLKKVKATGNDVFGGSPDPQVFLDPAGTLTVIP